MKYCPVLHFIFCNFIIGCSFYEIEQKAVNIKSIILINCRKYISKKNTKESSNHIEHRYKQKGRKKAMEKGQIGNENHAPIDPRYYLN